ncbi:MAG TPA: hypothetical protein VGL81_15945 [Polyangiaceae bacterium]
MNQHVAARRLVVPVLLAGLTLCGSLGWAPSASAREPAGRVTVTAPHAVLAARTFTPSVRSTSSTRSPVMAALPSRTVAVHFTPAKMPAPNGSMLATSKL